MATQTYLSSSSSSAILSKWRWSLCPSLASINQWQLRLFPLLWLLTDGGGGDSIRPTVALRIHPPQDTAVKKKKKDKTPSILLLFFYKNPKRWHPNSNLSQFTYRHIEALGCSSVAGSCWHTWPPHDLGPGNLGHSGRAPDLQDGYQSLSLLRPQETEGTGRRAERLSMVTKEDGKDYYFEKWKAKMTKVEKESSGVVHHFNKQLSFTIYLFFLTLINWTVGSLNL